MALSQQSQDQITKEIIIYVEELNQFASFIWSDDDKLLPLEESKIEALIEKKTIVVKVPTLGTLIYQMETMLSGSIMTDHATKTETILSRSIEYQSEKFEKVKKVTKVTFSITIQQSQNVKAIDLNEHANFSVSQKGYFKVTSYRLQDGNTVVVFKGEKDKVSFGDITILRKNTQLLSKKYLPESNAIWTFQLNGEFNQNESIRITCNAIVEGISYEDEGDVIYVSDY